MKKISVILVVVTLLCALLVACGADDQNTADPQLSEQLGIDTSVAVESNITANIISPHGHDDVYASVYTYLSALPTVGEDTPAPQVFVVQSYEELRAVYEAANACEDAEMDVKGSWENIGRSDQFYQTYFNKNFAVVVTMLTDDGYYDLRLDREDSDEGIALEVFGARSYEQPAVRERHVLFCGFEGKYEGQSIDIDFGCTPFSSQIEQNMYAYFSSAYSEIPSKPYFVVQSYEEIMEVYKYAVADPTDYGSYSLGIKGNWRAAMQNDAYTEDFFKDGYLVVVMKQTESGSYDFDCTCSKQDGKLIIKLDGALPYVSTDDIGSFMLLCPFEGKYEGESIEITGTSARYSSRIQQAIEIKFGPRPILDNADGFHEEEFLVLNSYGELCELYKYAASDPKSYNALVTHIEGNWQDAQQNDSYGEQFFNGGSVVAVMTLAHSNSTFDIRTEKNGNDITVYVHENAHANNEENVGYIHLVPIEDYDWLHDKVKIERSSYTYKPDDE